MISRRNATEVELLGWENSHFWVKHIYPESPLKPLQLQSWTPRLIPYLPKVLVMTGLKMSSQRLSLLLSRATSRPPAEAFGLLFGEASFPVGERELERGVDTCVTRMFLVCAFARVTRVFQHVACMQMGLKQRNW